MERIVVLFKVFINKLNLQGNNDDARFVGVLSDMVEEAWSERSEDVNFLDKRIGELKRELDQCGSVKMVCYVGDKPILPLVKVIKKYFPGYTLKEAKEIAENVRDYDWVIVGNLESEKACEMLKEIRVEYPSGNVEGQIVYDL